MFGFRKARAALRLAEANEQYALAREEQRAARSRGDCQRINRAERAVYHAKNRLLRAEEAAKAFAKPIHA